MGTTLRGFTAFTASAARIAKSVTCAPLAPLFITSGIASAPAVSVVTRQARSHANADQTAVNANDVAFGESFPYVALPHSGSATSARGSSGSTVSWRCVSAESKPSSNNSSRVNNEGAMTNCASGPTTYTMPENAPHHGKFPFSFASSARGQLLVTEVFGTGLSPTASAVQPFTLNADGSLTPISAPVGTGQVVVCWIVVTGSSAYTANYLANDVSSLAIGRDGSVTTIQGNASGSAPLVTPIDVALSPNGKYLYQLSPGNGTVVPFAVDAASGSVTALAPATLGANSAAAGHQGIATIDYPM